MEGWENSNGSASYRLEDMVNCCTVWCIPLAFSAQQHCSDNNRGGSTSQPISSRHIARHWLCSLFTLRRSAVCSQLLNLLYESGRSDVGGATYASFRFFSKGDSAGSWANCLWG